MKTVAVVRRDADRIALTATGATVVDVITLEALGL
jgi:hypothetical protein